MGSTISNRVSTRGGGEAERGKCAAGKCKRDFFGGWVEETGLSTVAEESRAGGAEGGAVMSLLETESASPSGAGTSEERERCLESAGIAGLSVSSVAAENR